MIKIRVDSTISELKKCDECGIRKKHRSDPRHYRTQIAGFEVVLCSTCLADLAVQSGRLVGSNSKAPPLRDRREPR